MKFNGKFKSRHGLLLGAAVALPFWSAAAPAEEKIFETNVTNDLTISSGEPEIGVDPKNPRHLAIIEFSVGSHNRPAYSFNPIDIADMAKDYEASSGNVGRVMLSTDGGNHWIARPPPVYGMKGTQRIGGGDPYLVYGPGGELYLGAEVGTPPDDPKTPLADTMQQAYVKVAVSTDGGKTFSSPQAAGTPLDRPWITADSHTGTVYTASSGPLNVATGIHNVPGADAPNDRWLVAWKPRLAAKSEPRRIGGPDFSGATGSTITAAHGIVAATFVLGGAAPGAGSAGGPPAPRPVPASLQEVVKGAVTACSMQAPCLFFETSADEGIHWTRHYVPVDGGFSPSQRANVAADPGREGHYAIAVVNPAQTNFIVLTTHDSGASWSQVALPQGPGGVKFKQWMAFGPSGVVGIVWKDRRDDLTPARQPGQGEGAGANRVFEAAFDVYAAISCDGGSTWNAPVRVNAETSPAGVPGEDDLAYIVLDDKYAHMVWGDRRLQSKITNVPGGMGGVQAFYGRLPFSVATHGAACGRK
jgi:hypothetical protein